MSPSSEDRDQGEKAGLYAAMGVREYFVYQPDPERRGYRLRGRRLRGEGYVDLQPVRGPGSVLERHSEVLSMAMWPVGARLRLRGLETGRELPWPEESEVECQRAAARARAEAAARERAEERARAAEARLAAMEARASRAGHQLSEES